MKMSGRLFEKHPGRYLHNTQPNVLNLRPGVSNFLKKKFSHDLEQRTLMK